MSKRTRIFPEKVALQAKYRKQNQFLTIFLLILFIPPLCLFPASPENDWQYSLYQYITQDLLITVGTKGPLPFFTVLCVMYITVYGFLVGCYMCFMLMKKYGLHLEYQQKFFNLFFRAKFESSKKYPWLEKPLIKKTLVSCAFLLSFCMGVLHLCDATISFPTRKSSLIPFLYNYQLGVIFGEMIMSLFTLLPIFYFGFLFVYLLNYFRGLGTGKEL